MGKIICLLPDRYFNLGTSAEVVIPTAFDRHMANMPGNPMMGMNRMADLYTGFTKAFNETLWRAALAAFITAVVVSIFFCRQVVAPVQAMMTASQHIADGAL